MSSSRYTFRPISISIARLTKRQACRQSPTNMVFRRIVGHADLTDPNFEKILAEHKEHVNLRGIRQQVYWHPTNEYWRFVDRQDFCLVDKLSPGPVPAR